jgi:hypothetical protein
MRRMHPCLPGEGREVAGASRGCPHPWNEVERAERSGGLHKRSAEDWGYGSCAREGGALLEDQGDLSRLISPAAVADR